ncbi:MAG: YkgJ family cysteine cluster protein [Methanoregulaceae archaeon]
MGDPSSFPIPYRIVALMQEQHRLFAYPLDQLAKEIRETGFRCGMCGMCCTRAINGNIFLLDHEVTAARKIDPASVGPAPDPEFCDQNGMFYSSGYSLRMKDDGSGSCWFLEAGRCRIYDRRFSVCRTYPYMLRGTTGGAESGRVWQKFARLHGHGTYPGDIPYEECLELAREIREYENAVLTQQVSFLETIHEYFSVHNFRHDPEMHAHQVQQLSEGKPVKMMVYHAGELEELQIQKPRIFL